MGTITASAFISLDGVINHMDKWHFDYIDAESDALAQEQIDTATALLMGRNTYDVYATVWPGRTESTQMRLTPSPSTSPRPPLRSRPGRTRRS